MLDYIRKSIKKKYFILLVLLAVMPIVTLGIISNRAFVGILEDELNISMNQTLEKASINIGLLLQRMSDLCDYLSRSSDILYTTNAEKPSQPDSRRWNEKPINRTLRDVSLFFNFPIHIYIVDEFNNVYSNINISKDEENRIVDAAAQSMESRGVSKLDDSIIWIGIRKNMLPGYDSERIYYLARNVIYRGRYQGVIFVGTGDYTLFRMLSNIKVSDQSKIFIFDRNSDTIQELFNSEGTDHVYLNVMEKLMRENATPRFITISGAKYNITFYKTSFNWNIAMITPVESIREKLSVTNFITVAVILISLLCIMIFLFLVNSNFVKPIIYLSKLMRVARKGNLDIRSDLKNIDEIGVLSEGFNKLVSDFKRMIEKIQSDEKKKKDLELKVLRSQIKPHFLYNTLNSIRWMAEMNKESKVGDSIVSLVRMLEYNTKGNEKSVNICDEVKYIKEYLTLQTLRYWSRFNTVFDISEDVMRCRIPKLTLQPVIENCLTHGLGNNKARIQITISGEIKDGNVIFRISDNGSGMDEITLRQTRENLGKSEEPDSRGIGLANVNQRIKLEFGDAFGLELFSIFGQGTDVIIKIPAIWDGGAGSSEDTDCR